MPLVGVNPSEVVLPDQCPAGTHEMTIIAMKNREETTGNHLTTKDGTRDKVSLVLKPTELDNTDNVFHTFLSTKEDDSEQTISIWAREIKEFIGCFGLDGELDEDELCASAVGCTGQVSIKIEEGDNGPKSVVGRFIV